MRATQRKSKDQGDFARCTINSDDPDSESDNSTNEKNYNKNNQSRFPELFRGTGQNGQILKEDMKNWSRKLHN